MRQRTPWAPAESSRPSFCQVTLHWLGDEKTHLISSYIYSRFDCRLRRLMLAFPPMFLCFCKPYRSVHALFTISTFLLQVNPVCIYAGRVLCWGNKHQGSQSISFFSNFFQTKSTERWVITLAIFLVDRYMFSFSIMLTSAWLWPVNLLICQHRFFSAASSIKRSF